MGTKLAFLLFVVIAAACVESTPVSPEVNTLVVHAVLDPGAQHQLIVVQQTTGNVEEQREVSGAVVTIATPDGRTLTAVERRDTAAVTGGVPFPKVTTVYDIDAGATGLISGGTYLLKVVAPDGRTVTGQTTIPNAVPSTTVAPTQSIDRLRDTVSLEWRRVAGARSYQVFVHSSAGTFSMFTSDTSEALPGTAQDVNAVDWCAADVREGYVPPDIVCQAFVRGLTHQLVVAAVDQNYFDYYRRQSDIFAGSGLVMHLDGGIGVFGSVVTVARRTIVVR